MAPMGKKSSPKVSQSPTEQLLGLLSSSANLPDDLSELSTSLYSIRSFMASSSTSTGVDFSDMPYSGALSSSSSSSSAGSLAASLASALDTFVASLILNLRNVGGGTDDDDDSGDGEENPNGLEQRAGGGGGGDDDDAVLQAYAEKKTREEKLSKLVSLTNLLRECAAMAHAWTLEMLSPESAPAKSASAASQERQACTSLFNASRRMHDLLLALAQEAATSAANEHDEQGELANAQASLADDVARLCEAWFAFHVAPDAHATNTSTRNAGRRAAQDVLDACGIVVAELTTQCLPFLLIRALCGGRPTDVKRAFAMRDSLTVLDFDDEESIAMTKELLLRCSVSASFLRSNEGRKFLSHVMLVDVEMMKEVYACVKAQIPNASSAELGWYGDVMFRAWRTSSGADLLTLESWVFGDLLDCAVLTADVKVAAKALQVLDAALHKHKLASSGIGKAVDETLHRLYEPVVFGSATAANASVRLNACRVMVSSFPLRVLDDADADAQILQQQLHAMAKLMADGCPQVRAEACRGCARMLEKFWELLPARVVGVLVGRIADDLSADAASPLVRSAALEGLKVLLGQPLAHAVLGRAIGSVGVALGDASRGVRRACVDLVVAARQIRGMPDIATDVQLLESLATDPDEHVRRKVGELLRTQLLRPDKLSDLLRRQPGAAVELLRGIGFDAARELLLDEVGEDVVVKVDGSVEAWLRKDAPQAQPLSC
ncbi:hypothetical protein PPROV_001018700 [Pycnococcus provasolii]|uniref:Uncharacterized protein n=1 Tax=Pycnococcus provasolii TaxID=41880 RepID=A0A830I344_9CHLO|nr:hypothetical protein PPROV_001018700 [Pycnococcus provasolii]